MNKKLIRPKKNRVLFGVSQGLGEYLNIDPVIIRILFVIITIWGGAGIILYIAGILLIPDENKQNLKNEIKETAESFSVKQKNDDTTKTKEDKTQDINSALIIGLIIIFIGLVFLLSNFVSWISLAKLWPIILIFIGVIIIGGALKDKI